jgi:SulP family sulfate permease
MKFSSYIWEKQAAMKWSAIFPILAYLPGYRWIDFRGDLMAGLTVGVMLVPQGMAYGMLAGLPPIYGLYAGLAPVLLYVFFGTSRYLSVGPVALVSLLVLNGISRMAAPGTAYFVQLAVATALLAGIIQILLGLFRLGFLVNFLSHPVMSGFTSAAAFVIGLSQIKFLFGIELPQTNRIQDIVAAAAAHIENLHPLTFGIGVGGILLILLLRKIKKTFPGALVTVVLGVLLVGTLRLDLAGVAIVGEVPQGLPGFGLPRVTFEDARKLLPLALTICLISFIESLAIARKLQDKHKDHKVLPNQELLALGLSKVGGAFFHATPTTGSFTRSAVNESTGARTGISTILAVIVVALTLLLLTPFFFYLPKALLASVIVVAVIGLVDYREAIHLWKTDRRDFYALIVTFAATLTLGIQSGVIAGVVLSLALMLYSNSRPHVAILGRLPNSPNYRNITRFEQARLQSDLLILRFDAQLYFGNAGFFQDTLTGLVEEQKGRLKAVVLDASSISDLDSSGARALGQVLDNLRSHEIQLYLAGVIGPVRDALQRQGLIEKTGGAGFLFFSVHEAVEAYNRIKNEEKPTK